MTTMQSSLLTRAVTDSDVKQVERILERCGSKDEIDGKGTTFTTRIGTAMMTAARGNGKGGVEFHTILNLIWSSYGRVTRGIMQGKQMENVLLETDTRNRWNVLMHGAKCGDVRNLELVLGFYREVFGQRLWRNARIRDSIDIANVDCKVKGLITEEIFRGSIAAVCGCATSRRKRSSTTEARRWSPEVTAVEKGDNCVIQKKRDIADAETGGDTARAKIRIARRSHKFKTYRIEVKKQKESLVERYKSGNDNSRDKRTPKKIDHISLAREIKKYRLTKKRLHKCVTDHDDSCNEISNDNKKTKKEDNVSLGDKDDGAIVDPEGDNLRSAHKSIPSPCRDDNPSRVKKLRKIKIEFVDDERNTSELDDIILAGTDEESAGEIAEKIDARRSSRTKKKPRAKKDLMEQKRSRRSAVDRGDFSSGAPSLKINANSPSSGDGDKDDRDVGTADNTPLAITDEGRSGRKATDDHSFSREATRDLNNGDKQGVADGTNGNYTADAAKSETEVDHDSSSPRARALKKIRAEKRALVKELKTLRLVQGKIASVEEFSKLRSERDSALEREEDLLKENKKLKAALRHLL